LFRGSVAEKTITRPEVRGKLTHAFSIRQRRTAS
jgi:hypothetical protein